MSYIDRDGRLRGPEQIRAVLRVGGVDLTREIVLSCSVGIASTHSALALAQAGVDARVYPGSWSQWSCTRGRPVAPSARPPATPSAAGEPARASRFRGGPR